MSHVMNTYARQPVAFVRGEGVWLWDEAGKKYLDALAGIAVNTLGYAHPRLTRALTGQIGRLMHTSNLFRIPLQEAAADRLAEITGLDEVFFCNSGLEANEAAIKIARKYGHERGIAEPAIVVMEKAFHGRSLATLSATGSRKVQAGFEPLVSGFVRVPLNDLDAVRTLAEHNRNGVPVGACVVGGRAKGVLKPGNHGSTFGGNPLAMTAVVTTIDTIKEESLLANAEKVGAVIRNGLSEVHGITEIRGMGLMIGLELGQPCGELVKQALDAGLVINVTADNVIRMLPPLVMTPAEGRLVVERLAPLVQNFLARRALPRAAAH